MATRTDAILCLDSRSVLALAPTEGTASRRSARAGWNSPNTHCRRHQAGRTVVAQETEEATVEEGALNQALRRAGGDGAMQESGFQVLNSADFTCLNIFICHNIT